MGSGPDRLPFGNTPEEEGLPQPIPPLPDIQPLVTKIRRQADKAKTIEGKVGFIEIGIAELQQIKTDGWRQYHELMEQHKLDDSAPFWSYDSDLDKAINELAILRQTILVAEADRGTTASAASPTPAPAPVFAAPATTVPALPDPKASSPDLMDVKQLASYLGVSESWIYKNYKPKGIPHFKLGTNLRFRRDEVDQWSGNRGEARPSDSPGAGPGKPKRAAKPSRQAPMASGSQASPVPSQDEEANTGVHPKILSQIERLVALLYEKSYLTQADSSRFKNWILKGARRSPNEDKIAWLKQRKSLVTCIILCHYAELVSIPETQGKKQPRPDFAASIERDFIAEGKPSLQNIDRDFARDIDREVNAFIEYMRTYARRNELEFSTNNMLAAALAEYYDDIDGSEGMAVEIKEIKNSGKDLDFAMMQLFHVLSTLEA